MTHNSAGLCVLALGLTMLLANCADAPADRPARHVPPVLTTATPASPATGVTAPSPTCPPSGNPIRTPPQALAPAPGACPP